MRQAAFVLSDKIKAHEINYQLYPVFWDEFDFTTIRRINPIWNEIKFLNDQGDDLSDDMKALPKDHGGIYIFIIKCDILETTSEYLAYIGRAQLSDNHSLKIRCRKYFYEYFGEEGRSKITRMIGKWGKYLYVKYAEIDDNNDTIELESHLINAILPPFNDQIPEKTIRQAVNAF
ncbi:MAG: hypothetical protein L3J08_03935 [Flavobacteriaceae bacterium]|nr:hypothetical protein [Flavobacteriaceae bacterium]